MGWVVVSEPEQFFYFCAVEPSGRLLNRQHGQMAIHTAIFTPSSQGALQPYSQHFGHHYCHTASNTSNYTVIRPTTLPATNPYGQHYSHQDGHTAIFPELISWPALRAAIRLNDQQHGQMANIMQYGHIASNAVIRS